MNNSKLEAQNAVAVQYGFKDWSDLWINGDLTPAIIEDLMEVYANKTTYKVQTFGNDHLCGEKWLNGDYSKNEQK